MAGDNGSALLAAMVVAILMVLLSVTALSVATRDVAAGISWSVAVRAELALRAGLSDVLTDTSLAAESLGVGTTRNLGPLALGGSFVSRSLERLDDSLFVLTATGTSRHGTAGPHGIRSAMILLRPCPSLSPGDSLGTSLCTLPEGGSIHLLP